MATALTYDGDGNQSAYSNTASDHPLAVEEWLASRVLEHVVDAGDVCRFALINKNFWGASFSDSVWQRRLPPERLLNAVLNASSGLEAGLLSKRDLYMQLCKPLPYDKGVKKFWLDPASGGDCYMISARGLRIAWGDTPKYWTWQPWPGAISEEVAYLHSVCWFDIRGTFRQILRPGKYLVSFRLQLDRPVGGWSRSPIKLCVQNKSYAHRPYPSEVNFNSIGAFKRRSCPVYDASLASHTVETLNPETFVHPQGFESGELLTCDQRSRYVHREEEQAEGSRVFSRLGAGSLRPFGRIGGIRPSAKGKGDSVGSSKQSHKTQFVKEWVECDVGDFWVEDDNGGRPVEVEFSMQEIEILWWKGGFVLDGVIVRPSYVADKRTIGRGEDASS